MLSFVFVIIIVDIVVVAAVVVVGFGGGMARLPVWPPAFASRREEKKERL